MSNVLVFPGISSILLKLLTATHIRELANERKFVSISMIEVIKVNSTDIDVGSLTKSTNVNFTTSWHILYNRI